MVLIVILPKLWRSCISVWKDQNLKKKWQACWPENTENALCRLCFRLSSVLASCICMVGKNLNIFISVLCLHAGHLILWNFPYFKKEMPFSSVARQWFCSTFIQLNNSNSLTTERLNITTWNHVICWFREVHNGGSWESPIAVIWRRFGRMPLYIPTLITAPSANSD